MSSSSKNDKKKTVIYKSSGSLMLNFIYLMTAIVVFGLLLYYAYRQGYITTHTSLLFDRLKDNKHPDDFVKGDGGWHHRQHTNESADDSAKKNK